MALTKTSKIVLFGGLGFIGQNLAQHFIDKGYKNITIFDKDPNKDIPTHKTIFKKATVRNFDMNTSSYKDIASDLKDADIIINLIFPYDEVRHRLDKELLEHHKDGKTKFLFLGSRLQYCKTEKKVSETSKSNPQNIYAQRMQSIEDLYHEYHTKYKVPVIFVRASNVYGHSHNFFKKNTTDAYLLRSLLHLGQVSFTLPRSSYKDMIYIDDFVDALLLLINTEKTIGERYNIGSGKKTTVRTMMKLSRKHFPHAKVLFSPKADSSSFVFDVTKLKQLGWRRKISFRKGFEMLMKKLN